MPVSTPTRCSPSSSVASLLPNSQSARRIDHPPSPEGSSDLLRSRAWVPPLSSLMLTLDGRILPLRQLSMAQEQGDGAFPQQRARQGAEQKLAKPGPGVCPHDDEAGVALPHL